MLFRSYFVYDLIALAEERFLVGTSHGMFLLVEGQWQPYSEREELINGYFLDLHRMPDGTLLFGTSDAGVFIQRGDQLEHIDKERGLSDNSVLGITADESGRIYLTTNKGVNVLSREARSEEHTSELQSH